MASRRTWMRRSVVASTVLALLVAAAPWAATAASPAPVVRPATPDGPVPPYLSPSLAAAKRDYPAPYLDGCHVQQNGRSRKGATCLYGDLGSSTTIVLFGDSHALSWFPAVEQVALREGWRLHVLTMSTCSPADIPIWNSNYRRVSAECTAWRKRAIAQIRADHPAVILVAGTRGFATVGRSGALLTGAERAQAWKVGMKHTLDRIVPLASRVILLGDTPIAVQDPPTCLAAHRDSVLACATPLAQALDPVWTDAERSTADLRNAGFVDSSLWVCPSTPCPVVIDGLLLYRDPGHLTATFAVTLGDVLDEAVMADIEQSLGITSFG